MIKVLLSDGIASLLVECADEAQAGALGHSAAWGRGGVSAWLLPHVPGATDADVFKIIEVLNNGGDLADVDDALHEEDDEGEQQRCRCEDLAADFTAIPFEHARACPLYGYDTESSASRQHYIDTGRYLRSGEADELPQT